MSKASVPACVAALALLGTVAVGGAAAETITFNFAGSSTPTATKTFVGAPPVLQAPGLTVSAVGGLVWQTSAGLGVGSATVDGTSESLLFDFTPNTVVFDTLTFTDVQVGSGQSGDAAALFEVVVAAETNLFTYTFTAADLNPAQPGTVKLDLTLAKFGLDETERTGLKFRLTGRDGNDAFSVGGLQVGYTAAAVPLPGVLAGGAALLGVVAVRRRGRRSVA